MQRHYFISEEHKPEDYFFIKGKVNDRLYELKSCNGIFSKEYIDYGSKVLMEAIIKKEKPLTGKVLDLGCGYGVISVALASEFKDAIFTPSDINKTAIELCNFNASKYHLKNVEPAVESDVYKSIEGTFNFIVTNPPIRAGKVVLKKIILGAYDKLEKGGSLYFVIKKKHGKDSIKKYMECIFHYVEVIKRDSGFYVLKATKE